MNCQRPKCGGELRVKQTYTLGCQKTQRLVCLDCKQVYVAVSVLQEVNGRGSGAKGQISKLRKPEMLQ